MDDTTYANVHGGMFGPVGEHVAAAALLFRDKLFRSGFVLPVIRLAPVAPYGKCMALSGNGGSLWHVPGVAPGIWLYLHAAFYSADPRQQQAAIEATVLHELLHNELRQHEESLHHRDEPWARRCQELSAVLGLGVKIERPRSRRIEGRVTTETPDGCLSYADLIRWPSTLLPADGPTLIERVLAL